MDFLDPKKERRTRISLLVGYGLVAVAITIGTVILLNLAFGYGLDKSGKVIQNGRVFVSSQPSGSDIFLNNNRYKSQTNTSILLPSAEYMLKVSRSGYRDWQRMVTVEGGDVQHFDYPFLFPKTLQTKPITELASAPALATQSLDRRWLVTLPAADNPTFTVYDIKDPTKLVDSTIVLPPSVYTVGTGAHTWAVTEWASDNRHVLLLHTYATANGPAAEYIVLDRQTPEASANVTRALDLNSDEALSLLDKKFDRYYVFNAAAQTLRTALLSGASTDTSKQLSHIVAFKPYAADMLLYVTSQPPTGKVVPEKVSVVLQQGQKTYTLQTLAADAPQYPLDLARYDGNWYVVVGASNDTGVYIYKNPQSTTPTASGSVAVWRLLKLANPSKVSFSSTAQFILAENGQQFAIYNAQNLEIYHYTTSQPLDVPQTYATWMDGNRLMYMSGGHLVVFDYDYQNAQALQASQTGLAPAFSPDFRTVYTLAPGAAAPTVRLNATALTTQPV